MLDAAVLFLGEPLALGAGVPAALAAAGVRVQAARTLVELLQLARNAIPTRSCSTSGRAALAR